MDLGRQKWQKPAISNSSEFIIFANSITMRLFYDFCRNEFFCSMVKAKIQNKMASIHKFRNLKLEPKIPKIQKIYAPDVDDWGIWVDFDIHYEGCIRLVLETKADLIKLKENPDLTEGGEKNATSCLTISKAVSRYSHESVAESPETSPDEDYGSKVKYHDLSTKEKTGQIILNLVHKVAHSKIFKAATNMKPIKKATEEVSSTRPR